MADETIKVSIDGSEGRKGAEEVAEGLRSAKSASDDLSASLDKTQGMLTRSWDLSKFKTTSDSIREMSQSANSATTTLNTMVAALVQPWPTTGPTKVVEILKQVVDWAKNAGTGLLATAASLTSQWSTASVNAVIGALGSLKTMAFDATKAVGSVVSSVSSTWSTQGISGVVRSLTNLIQSASSATGGIQALVSATSSRWSTLGPAAVQATLNGMSASASAALGSLNNLIQGQGRLVAATRAATRGLQEMNSVFDMLWTKSGPLRQVLSVLIPVDLIAHGATVFFEATNRLQGFLSTMSVVTGSSKQSRVELQALFDMANKYGVNVTNLSESFAKLSAAAKGTTLEGAKIRQAFEAITVASSAMHLSSEDTRLVLYALQQMVSKGTVSFEELRRQMAERFPGAMKIAAESMGMTDQAFQKLVKSGKLMTEDFLPAFSQAILQRFAPALEVSTTSLLAAVNRLSNAWENLLRNVAESSLTNSATRAVNKLSEVVNSISPATIDAIGDGLGHIVDYIANIIADVNAEKINTFFTTFAAGAKLAGDALGLVIDYAVSNIPKLQKQIEGFQLFSGTGKFADLSVWERIVYYAKETGQVLTTDKRAAEELGIHVESWAENYLKTVQEAKKLKEEQAEISRQAALFGKETDSMDERTRIFHEHQKKLWDNWGDDVQRKVAQAATAMANLGNVTDQVLRRQQQLGRSDQNARNASTQDKNIEAQIEALRQEGIELDKTREKKLKINNIQAEYNQKTRELRAIQLDLAEEMQSSTGGTPERRVNLMREENKLKSELIPIEKELNSRTKIATTAANEYTNLLGRGNALLAEAQAKYAALGDELESSVTPAFTQLLKIQETAYFKSLSFDKQQAVRSVFVKAADLEAANKEYEDYIKFVDQGIRALEKSTETNEKEAASLNQKTISLNQSAKASEGAAKAELDRFLATDQMRIVIDEMMSKDPVRTQQMLDQARAAAQQVDAQRKYYLAAKETNDQAEKHSKSIENETAHLREKAQQLDLTKEQQDLNTVSLREMELAEIDHLIALAESSEQYTNEIELLKKRRAEIIDNIDAWRGLAQAEASQTFKKNWIQAIDQISDKFSNFIKDGIENGWSAAFKKMWKDFLNWGLEAIAKLTLQKVAISVFPSLASGFAQANNGPFGVWGNIAQDMFGGPSAGPGSNLPGASGSSGTQAVTSAASQFSTGYSIFDKLGNIVTGGFNGLKTFFSGMFGSSAVDVGTLDNFAPSVMGNQSAYGLSGYTNPVGMFQTGGTGLFGVGNSGLSLSGVVGGAGIGAVEGMLLAKLFGNERNSSSMQIGGTIGGAAGSIFGPIGSIVGAAIGSAIGSLFKSGGGPKEGGYATSGVNLETGASVPLIGERYFTPSEKDSDVKTITDTIKDSYKSVANSLGIKTGAVSFGLGFDTDPKGTAPNRISTGVTIGGTEVYSRRDIDVGRDPAELEARLKLESQRALLAALQSSELPTFLANWMKSVSAADATQEDIDKILGVAQALKLAVDTVPELGAQFEAMSPEQINSLTEAMGGMANFLASQQYLADNFKTSTDKTVEATEDLNKTFGDLGLEVPKTHKEFLDLLGGLDLTTEAGRTAYASIMGVSDSFVTLHGTAEQARQALNSAAEAGQRAFDENLLTPKERTDLRIDNDLAQLATGSEKVKNVLTEMNLTTIPTTLDGFKKFVLAVKAKYGADSDEYKIIIALTPTVLDLNDAYKEQKGAVEEVTKVITTSVLELSNKGRTAADTLLASYRALADASTGNFGDKLAMQIDLIKSSLEAAPGVVQGTIRDPAGGVRQGYVAQSGTVDQKAYANRLISSYDTMVSQLSRFLQLSVQFDEAKAEQLVGLQDWYEAQKKVFGFGSMQANADALAALETVFHQKWDAIVNGGTAAAQSLDDFIQKIHELADSTGGDAGQKASLELALSKPKLQEMQTQYGGLDPNSATAKALKLQIDQLTSYNSSLQTQVEHFSTYSVQFGAEMANQLVELEINYESWKKSVGNNAEALAILQQIFDAKWKEIVDGSKEAAASLDEFLESIRSFADDTRGNAGQQARLEQAMIGGKIQDLQAEYAKYDPTSAQAIGIKKQITDLEDYNARLGVQIQHFTDYSEQYGESVANQLIELESNYESWKKSAGNNAEALAVLAEIFDQQWNQIIDGASGAASELDKLRQSIRDFLDGLKTSDLSPLTPMQKLQEAKNQYEQTLSKAQSGDLTALGDITKDAQQYLTLARSAYASSSAYTNIFDSVVNSLSQLSGYEAAPQTSPVVQHVESTAAPLPIDRTVETLQGIQSSVTNLTSVTASAPNYSAQFTSVESYLDRLISIEDAQPDYTAVLNRIADAVSSPTEISEPVTQVQVPNYSSQFQSTPITVTTPSTTAIPSTNYAGEMSRILTRLSDQQLSLLGTVPQTTQSTAPAVDYSSEIQSTPPITAAPTEVSTAYLDGFDRLLTRLFDRQLSLISGSPIVAQNTITATDYSTKLQQIDSTPISTTEPSPDYTEVLNRIASRLSTNLPATSTETRGTFGSYVTEPVATAAVSQSETRRVNSPVDDAVPTDGTPLASQKDVQDLRKSVEELVSALARMSNSNAKQTQELLRRATEAASKTRALLK